MKKRDGQYTKIVSCTMSTILITEEEEIRIKENVIFEEVIASKIL